MKKSTLTKVALIAAGGVIGHLFGDKAVGAIESIKK